MKVFKIILDTFKVIFFIPFVIAVIIIVSPIFIVIIIVTKAKALKDKKKLKELIKINDGQIFFLYSDYNNFNFYEHFKNKFKNVKFIKVKHYTYNDDLANYLIKDTGNQSYPKLIRIKNDVLIEKRHYNSFKYFYRRKKDLDSFERLIIRSIINLKKE